MTTHAWMARLGVLMMGVSLLGFSVGCPMTNLGGDTTGDTGGDTGGSTAAFANANSTRGGALYDKFWEVTGMNAPIADHPLWASRPDTTSNTRTGADTWRCKECHGWDYKGVNGAYATGSHLTGIAGIFNTMLSAQEAFDLIKTDHGYGGAGLSDEDIWDLAKFVLEGQVETDNFIDGMAFIGSVMAGQTVYEDTCMVCHGDDGLSLPPGADEDHDEFVGLVANDNPWEYLHKIRFGQPGSVMPPQAELLTDEQIADLGVFSQTLPEAPAAP